ncbi:MAG: DUF6801 domain-containing protein, partial [Solirubrobacteraceae bacterium]
MSGSQSGAATRRKALALSAIAASAAFGAVAAPAQANFKKTLTYSCLYPYLLDPQPLTVNIDAVIPDTIQVGVPTGQFTINVVATAGGDTSSAVGLIGASSVSGTSSAVSTVYAPGITASNKLAIKVPITVPQQKVTTTGDLTLSATGKTPSLTFPQEGSLKITVDSIKLLLKAQDASGNDIPNIDNPDGVPNSDSDPLTFDVACTLAVTSPPQDTTL